MHRLAKIRTAGTLLAILPPLLWCGAATSQSVVTNDQVQLGDVFAEQTLNVVAPSDQIVAVTNALGNGVTGTVDGNALDLRSNQSLQANVRGSTTLNATDYTGAQAALATTATGNAGTANVVNGGSLTARFNQDVSGDQLVRAGTGILSPNASATNISGSAQSVVNSVGFGADNGSNLHGTVNQTSTSSAEASTGVQLKYVSGSANFAGTTINNNVTAAGANGSSMDLNIKQSATGNHTQGTAFSSGGTMQSVNTAGTAIANNVSINNTGPGLNVVTDQNNTSYVRAQTDNNAYSFGSVTAAAYGVGNSVLAGEVGGQLHLDNNQVEAGGVLAQATAGGNTGYDISAQSTAIGNAVTGYACSECGGVINVGNRQTNSSNITSSSTINVGGSNRTATGISTAVGNTATFYSSKPGG
jgi:hypothetical protein